MSTIMEKKEHVSEEDVRLTISSMDGLGGNLGKVPIDDLMVDILSRLPAKSIARVRCVAKNWDCLLRNPYFTDMFLTRSSASPRLLFTVQGGGKWSFFSSPEYLLSDPNSNLVVVDKHMDVPKDYTFRVCAPVCGLLCTRDEWNLSGKRDARMMICNPSTGQFKSLPKVRSRRGHVVTFIGYDPIENQYKVLCMTVCERPCLRKAEEHQVLTLGTGKLKWRMIDCAVIHYPYKLSSEICINGVIFYLATAYDSRNDLVVCFDVKQEKFTFLVNKDPEDLGFPSTLINYKGKLGGIRHESIASFMDGGLASFELWVMDDTEEFKWSKHIHILPPLWKELVAETTVYVVGMIGASEIVFSPLFSHNPFYIFHLDMERNSLKRVEIQGIGPLNGQKIYTFINHVENLKLINM